MHSSFSMRWDGTKCGKEETRINIPQKKKKKKEEDTGGRGRGWRYGTEESKSRPSGRAFLFRAGAEQSSAVQMCISDRFKSIEVGHIFLLGDKYSKPLNVKFVDKENKNDTFVHMGCYGIGVSRLKMCIRDSSM